MGGLGKGNNPHLLGEEAPFFHIDVKGHMLEDDRMQLDRRAMGIPFLVDDDAALDAAYQHHQTAVEIASVERVLLPFWLSVTSAGGTFDSEVLLVNPSQMSYELMWHHVPAYTFSYPFEEHLPMNQICATYDPIASYAETVCAGMHVPSMLLSRFELLEELEMMEAPPRFVPFSLSTKSAVTILEKRLDRNLLHKQAKKELKKYHGHFKAANIKFVSTVAEVTKMRPVFLPVYAMTAITQSNSEPIPMYVCGATGRTAGPVIHLSPTKQFFVNGLAGAAALTAGALMYGPVEAAVGAMAAAGAASHLVKMKNSAKAANDASVKAAQLAWRQSAFAATDTEGYKWSVEDEETMEYSYREEVRARARRRAQFEQRVREEAARDDARAQSGKFKRSARAARRASRPGAVDRDPLGYYAALGLKGSEDKVNAKDIAKAFRAQAQKTHPDTAAPELQDLAKAQMQKLVEAYSVLRDATLRREYDEGVYSRPGTPSEE